MDDVDEARNLAGRDALPSGYVLGEIAPPALSCAPGDHAIPARFVGGARAGADVTILERCELEATDDRARSFE